MATNLAQMGPEDQAKHKAKESKRIANTIATNLAHMSPEERKKYLEKEKQRKRQKNFVDLAKRKERLAKNLKLTKIKMHDEAYKVERSRIRDQNKNFFQLIHFGPDFLCSCCKHAFFKTVGIT